MNVGVAFAKQSSQMWIRIDVPDGSTVRDVIERSGFLQQFPEIDLEKNKVGIFGTVAKLTAPVKEGDRVEIYRPIYPEAELLDRKR
ncbi:RnfH family protein [Tropicimonas marinistellae]|uniref:RnfH family protein n=1 Tax=Tropicimonas marinistellae TaxID=1739787 RepID=UPI000831D876|nr:RnfH family protein [Tropicimonas marinistellae]